VRFLNKLLCPGVAAVKKTKVICENRTFQSM